MEALEKFFNLRFYILTIRFFPLFLAIVALFACIMPVYGIFHIYTFCTVFSIVLAWVFSEMLVRFKAKIKHTQKLHEKGKLIEVYQVYNELQSETL